METQVLLAGRIGFLNQEQVNRVMDNAAEVGKLVNGLYNSL